MANLSTVLISVRDAMKRHSPEILTGIGIAGMITTTVMAIKATPKALILIEERKSEDDVDMLAPVEMVKTVWKCYIPMVITGSLSIFCLIGSCSVNARRNAALAAAYTFSESALKEYQEKVVEHIGDKKERAVRTAIAKDRLDKDPITNREIIITQKGDTLCYDAHAGRYFKSDIEKIKRIITDLNTRMLDDMYISLNEFYWELGLDGTKLGEDLGWNINDRPNHRIEIDFDSHLANNETPCLVLNFRVAPRYDFQK